MKYEIHSFQWLGHTHRIYRRPKRKGGVAVAPAAGDHWYHRLGKSWTSLQTHIKEDAIRIYKHQSAEMDRDSNAWEQQRQAGIQRKAKPAATLGQLADLYHAAAKAAGLKPKTVVDNVSALGVFARTALGPLPHWRERTLTELTARAVFAFRQAVTTACDDLDPGDAASAQRSANSTLAKVRSMLNPSACEHYRMAAALDLPANLDEFRTAPGFRDVTKHDYEIPSDSRIQATLEDLEATKASHPARYVACWLAIGFGLRRSEAACVRRDWFRQIDGRWHIEIRAVADALDATTERAVTKNGQVRPLIPCANGAWDRLAPFIQDATQPSDSYLIAGTGTYRREHLFREISLWLRRHGWQTQKAYHELRAWAGCQVGMAFGFDVASQWLRHGSIVTTQQFYGRYLNTLRKVDDRPAVTFPATVSPAVSQTAQSA